MPRKLQGGRSGKGLKGLLARQKSAEKTSTKLAHNAEIQKDLAEKKVKSMKSGSSSKKNQAWQKQQRGFIPFDKDDSVLLVGEGDFSFALSIVEEALIDPENLIATSFDTREQLLEKYPDIEDTLLKLVEYGVHIKHGIDATKLAVDLKLINPVKAARRKPLKTSLTSKRVPLNYIMFNFPHTGRGMKDMERNIRDHQKLVLSYVQNCKEVFEVVNNQALNDFGGYNVLHNKNGAFVGKIAMTVFEGEPYDSWAIKSLARSIEFRVERSGKFDWDLFPGYHHRRTDGMGSTTKKAEERDARIYVFEKDEVKEAKAKVDSDDDE